MVSGVRALLAGPAVVLLAAACSPRLDLDDVVAGCVQDGADLDEVMEATLHAQDDAEQPVGLVRSDSSLDAIVLVVAPGSSPEERAALVELAGAVAGVAGITDDPGACRGATAGG